MSVDPFGANVGDGFEVVLEYKILKVSVDPFGANVGDEYEDRARNQIYPCQLIRSAPTSVTRVHGRLTRGALSVS